MKDQPVLPPANKEFLTTPKAILIGSLIISISILVGTGVIRVKGSNKAFGITTSPAPSSQVAPEDTNPVRVSIVDAPVQGDKNAPITVVEFSDYECPFCKNFYSQTLPSLKKDYIDTGKVKLVYKDYPLSFHDPLSTKESIAALCAKEQGGDTAYYKYHDLIFTNTNSSGSGLTTDNLYKFAADLNLNTSDFKSCLDSEKYKDIVKKELDEASKIGVSGTPTFIIGKSTDNGTIEGTKIVGAVPYNNIKSQLDSLLK